MRPDRIVMTPPAFDDDLSFSEGVEDLAVEQLIAKAGVEALDVAILPRTAGLDIGSLGADGGDPSLDSLGDELRSIVGPDVTGNAAQDEQIGENVDDIDCFELASDTDRQAFVGKLVNDIEHPISASIVGAVLDKVVGPDMIAVLRPQAHARSVCQPEPATLGLLRWDLQPLASPDTLDPLVVDYPTRLAQELGDLAIAVAAVLDEQRLTADIIELARPRRDEWTGASILSIPRHDSQTAYFRCLLRCSSQHAPGRQLSVAEQRHLTVFIKVRSLISWCARRSQKCCRKQSRWLPQMQIAKN